MADSVAISPAWLVPSSTTAAPCSAPRRSSVSGRPHWLLNDEAGLSTSQRVASTAAVSSLAVVLPMEPVMATTGTENFERCQAASRPRARVVSSTRTSGTLAGGSSGSVWTTTQAAPRAAASARKAWPFSRWPTIAKNASPTWRVRESIDTPATGTPRSPLTSAPSVARTSSWTLNAAMRLLTRPLRQQPPRDVAVGQTGGDLAHDRPLGPIAVAAAPEHDAEPPRRDLARRRQHPLQRVRGMGVIHDDEEWLPRPHLLEPAGHRLHAAERAGGGVRRQPQCPPDAEGGEQVHHVVLADQRRGERQPARRCGHRQAHAVERRGPLAGAHTVVRAETVGQRLEAEPRHHTGGGRVVAVHDGDAPRLR